MHNWMKFKTIQCTPINFSIACHSQDVINSVYELYEILIRFFGRFLNQIRNLSGNLAIEAEMEKKNSTLITNVHAHMRSEYFGLSFVIFVCVCYRIAYIFSLHESVSERMNLLDGLVIV